MVPGRSWSSIALHPVTPHATSCSADETPPQRRQKNGGQAGGSERRGSSTLKGQDARNPEGVSAEASTLSGLSSVRCRAGDPTPSGRSRTSPTAVRFVRTAGVGLATWPPGLSLDLPASDLSVRRGESCDSPWSSSARRSRRIPVRCSDLTVRPQFPADFRLTFLPASRPSGPTSPAVARRVGRRRRVSPSTWREK